MLGNQSLCSLLGINHKNLSREEIFLLEAEIFVLIYHELIDYFKEQNKEYFRFIKFTSEMENDMLEENFICLIINDILSTCEYTLQGISYYTNLPEDTIYDLASGINTKPSAVSLLKILGLHISVRKDLYNAIKKKLTTDDPAIA